MSGIHIRHARVLTMLAPGEYTSPAGGRRGRELGTLGVISQGDVLIEGDRITSVSPSGAAVAATQEIDAAGRVLMPGFVDCHTHACWTGNRIDEWEKKLAGATYLDILNAGGGIMSTVRAVRNATQAELAAELRVRLDRMLRLGSTTIEVKSGYGLTAKYELRMLQAIRAAGSGFEGTVIRTALLGHAIDPDAASAEEFFKVLMEEIWLGLSTDHRGVAIDAFCEKGALSVEQCSKLFGGLVRSNHDIRVHADQFTSMGMISAAVGMGARSVDHLEATVPEDLARLAASDTFGVMLPVCGFHLDGRYANGRGFLDAGGKLAVATNFNPGSAPSPSMPFAIALAVRHLRLTPAEAIGAATVNPAVLLNLSDRGYIAPGARADLLLLRHTDERALAYEVGDNPVDKVIAGGEIVV